MKEFLEKLRQQVAENPPNYGDADSVLGLLYECFNENNPYDSEQIKADFEELYRQMNGMPLREMDRIVYPVCKLCRDHERAGVVEGIKIGVRLLQELGYYTSSDFSAQITYRALESYMDRKRRRAIDSDSFACCNEYENITFLDYSCGCGEFLLAVIQYFDNQGIS